MKIFQLLAKKKNTSESYLGMQKKHYDRDVSNWSLDNLNPVVGSYNKHNQFEDYEKYPFRGINTTDMIALEYGAGPGRNLIRFNSKFRRIDAVDISEVNKEKCKENLLCNNRQIPNYFITTGDNIPAGSNSYDLVFSVICLQHICVHEIRYAIMTDIY